MEQYWLHIIQSLTNDDASIIGILVDGDSTTRIKAMKTNSLSEKSGLSEAKYRKVISKLVALRFIDVDNSDKQYGYFVSDYGLKALESIIEINHNRSVEV